MKKIVLFGPESTGKTWLAQHLAARFGTVWVPEYARTYLEAKQKYYDFYSKGSSEICTQEDILPIVLGQIATEDALAAFAQRFVFYDTNPLQTKVYVNHYYKTDYRWLLDILQERHYDHYLLTGTDIPWQPDPLRDRPESRGELWQLFENELKSRKLSFNVIEGNFEERARRAAQIVEQLP